MDGNYLGKKPDYKKIAMNDELYRTITRPAPFPCRIPVQAKPIDSEYKKILKGVGASKKRDDTDARIVKEFKKGTTTFSGSVTGIPGIIDSENDVL